MLAPVLLMLASCGNDSGSGIWPSDASSSGPLSSATAGAPAAPAGVSATAGNGEVTLTWNTVSGATSYNVYYLTYRNVTAANAKQMTGAVSGEPIKGLENEVTYYFRIAAVNGAGEGELSAEVSARPMPALPGIPGNVKLEGGLEEAMLSWQAVPYAETYTIYYDTAPGLATRLAAGETVRSFKGLALPLRKITQLNEAPGHYYFIVTAENVSGEGPASVEMAAVAKSAFKTVAGGDGFSAAIRTLEPELKVLEGAVYTWGNNSNGELGTNGGGDHFTAVQVPTISTVTDISAGAWHAVALKTDQSVWDWGANDRGQLAFKYSTARQLVPVEATLWKQPMTAIAAGFEHSVSLKDDGTVWTWGHNQMGQLGYAAPDCYDPNIVGYTCSLTPKEVPGITGEISGVAAGELHTLAVSKSGISVWAWGRNTTGQLGSEYPYCPDGVADMVFEEFGVTISPPYASPNTKYSCSTKPVEVIMPKDVLAAAAGTYHSVALMRDGTVFTWGGNSFSQLGHDTDKTCQIQTAVRVPCTTTPSPVTGLDHIAAISAGAEHTLALKNDGTVWAWGRNNKGQLGNDVNYNTDLGNAAPTQVAGLTGITAIAAGKYHSVALKNDGTVWAWGYNNHGQLGNNTWASAGQIAPTQVQGLTPRVAIVPGM